MIDAKKAYSISYAVEDATQVEAIIINDVIDKINTQVMQACLKGEFVINYSPKGEWYTPKILNSIKDKLVIIGYDVNIFLNSKTIHIEWSNQGEDHDTI